MSTWRGWTRRRWSALGLLLSLAASLAACGEGTPEIRADTEAPPLLAEVPGTPVARVGGVAITDLQLRAAMARRGEGTTAPQVLGELITLEVLAQESVRRGLDAEAAVHLAKRQAMVQRLVEDEIEAQHPASAVGGEAIDEAYDTFSMDFFVPDLVTASHVLVEVAEDADETTREAARALADEVRTALAATPMEEDDLRRIAGYANLRGFHVRHEVGLTFPKRAVLPMEGEKARYQVVVEPFADAAFALDGANPLSEPVATVYGYHVIHFEKLRKGVRPPLEVVRGPIRDELARRTRSQHVRLLLQRLFREARVEVDEEPVIALAQRAEAVAVPAP